MVLQVKGKVELVMRVKDRYQRGQIRHRDLSREAARTQSSSTSLEIRVIRKKRTSPFLLSAHLECINQTVDPNALQVT
jgi:hypothetical protein